ncbi:MAG TPA: hypothetical protein VFV51_11980 [Vicinamibacterales bacterium]|nr:hypothetical protein [Vicinamibacterales bacterium]
MAHCVFQQATGYHFEPLLRFTVSTGLEIVSRHAMRHLQQAEHVKAHPQFPGA